MSFERLCDLHMEHGYYNGSRGTGPGFKLVPSLESAESIRKKRITVLHNGDSFSFYGDVYRTNGDGGRELADEFKLSFALLVNDPYFFPASDLLSPPRDLPGTEMTLKQGNPRTTYYFHNRRATLIGDKAYLSAGSRVLAADIIPIYPQSFCRPGLRELTDLTLSSGIKHTSEDDLGRCFRSEAVVNPSAPSEINRSLRVDLGHFSPGHYRFSYQYESATGPESETADFYLDDRFYGLRPFAVVDLYFYGEIAADFQVLDRDFYIVVGARKSTWRYKVVNKYNTYSELTITPSDTFAAAGTQETLKNGVSATVFESLVEQEAKQVLKSSYELSGKHVETLGMAPDEDDETDTESTGDAASAASRPIIRLPNPKAENLVLETVPVGDHEETRFYSDLFIYV